MHKPYFEIMTLRGVRVRTTADYWARIVTFKHPAMRGKENLVKSTLSNPVEIRRSQKDPKIYLYYAPHPLYHICAVVKHLDSEGFIITAYRTDSIKEGERLWPL